MLPPRVTADLGTAEIKRVFHAPQNLLKKALLLLDVVYIRGCNLSAYPRRLKYLDLNNYLLCNYYIIFLNNDKTFTR